MTVKTKAKKPGREPTLFEVFGPGASEHYRAANLRAAQRSMDEMAALINQSDYMKKKLSKKDG